MKEVQRRVLILAIVIIAIVVSATAGYIYLGSLSSANPKMTVIRIPKGSSIQPAGFSVSDFQKNFVNGSYPFPVNATVAIGVDNSIVWVNDDTEGHTVTALVAPVGALKFNSGLISEGKSFSVSLTVPGVYKYTCAWHNWLAGKISVNPA
jgi:plastocyanin